MSKLEANGPTSHNPWIHPSTDQKASLTPKGLGQNTRNLTKAIASVKELHLRHAGLWEAISDIILGIWLEVFYNNKYM